jgi:hypothetical protein
VTSCGSQGGFHLSTFPQWLLKFKNDGHVTLACQSTAVIRASWKNAYEWGEFSLIYTTLVLK